MRLGGVKIEDISIFWKNGFCYPNFENKDCQRILQKMIMRSKLCEKRLRTSLSKADIATTFFAKHFFFGGKIASFAKKEIVEELKQTRNN